MFCSNCGKQIPENTKFCSHCGTQQTTNSNVNFDSKTTVNYQNTAEAVNPKMKKTPKKKSNILIVLVVALGAFLIGKFLIAPAMTSEPSDEPYSGNKISQSQQSAADTPNPAYEAVFEGTYIIHFQSFFNMETSNFVSEQDNGIIYCADYGYEDDVVKQWVETMYIPIEGYTDSQKTELENDMRSKFASLEDVDCCTVDYGESEYYFRVTLKFTDVDKAENYSELYAAGIISVNGLSSMSATEERLLAEGAVKK